MGLGDYIDRPPADCAEGSVANALHLLSVVAEHPDRVWLIQGNHETVRRIPVLPEHLAEEVDQLWGPKAERYGRIIGLLERGPLAVLLPGRAYLAHAGFPHDALGDVARQRFAHPDEEVLLDVVWRECGASRIRRGLGPPFTEREMNAFLGSMGVDLFVRGHDPDLTNRPAFSGRCLTLHTSRLYERFGGVVIARIPLTRPVHSSRDIVIEHLESEGRIYPEPRPRPD